MKAVSQTIWLNLLLELTKVRITFAVILTAGMGYFLSGGWFDAGFGMCLLGTFLLASGSSALNQVQDVKVDARMTRTRNRPIPAGRIDRSVALFISILLMLAGLVVLTSIGTNAEALLILSGLAVFWYNGVYTYLKRVTAFAVVPGALIGAIPPVMGYAAAGGDARDPLILLVATFFFIWQVPHFWLLLLMLGEQYEEAGLPSLTRIFSRQQLARITFMWILATAAGGLVFPALARGEVSLPWSLAMVLASVWLAGKAASILWIPADQKQPFRRAFIQINTYALVVVVCLSLSALGATWR
jgi:protoheme IX farnesyltransferase